MYVYLLATNQNATQRILKNLDMSSVEGITALVDRRDVYLYVLLQKLKAEGAITDIAPVQDILSTIKESASLGDGVFCFSKDTLDSIPSMDSVPEPLAIPNVVNCPFVIPHQQAWGNVPLEFANTWSTTTLRVHVEASKYALIYDHYKKNRQSFKIPSFYVRTKDFVATSIVYWSQAIHSEIKSDASYEALGKRLCASQKVVVCGENPCFDLEGLPHD